jgi:lysine 2,3-aminomutase
MERWRKQLRNSVMKPEALEKALKLEPRSLRAVAREYPIRITPYFLRLIKRREDPLWKQVVPSQEELRESICVDDPLNEEGDSPVPHLVHRYPDRALLMVTNQCPIYCRFCTRKRLIGKPGFISREHLRRAVAYLRDHQEVRDVILSGGDPLLLPDAYLEEVLKALRAIPHLEIIRIGTRVPGSLPQRITARLCRILKKHHPLYMNLHFNHPDEITPQSRAACKRLADAGIPLGAQIVLLKGVNDDPETMKLLVRKLLAVRVKPYYLYQADLVKGTEHFRTPVESGLEILRHIQGFTSGMAVPTYVIDAPGGGGKIPILPPDNVLEWTPREVILKNYKNDIYRYPQPLSSQAGQADPEPATMEAAEKEVVAPLPALPTPSRYAVRSGAGRLEEEA